ncbi:glycosyl transferase family 2 domain-containing protein [Phthorimaea operculella]|nr:glycosyl transferase family 2 domain-containing protein [Phthorimaea operculella]
MREKWFRTVFILSFTWNVTLAVVESTDDTPTTPLQEFELNLKKFAKTEVENNNNYTSPFQSWHLISSNEIGIPLKEKYKAVMGADFPPGKNGEPVFLHFDVKNPLRAMIQQGWRDHAFNEFVSDIIPINRSLPDYRDEWCKSQNYSKSLPKASVIITFYNEAWSTLIRTIHTVLNQSSDHLLKQIILFDDNSDMHHLKTRLDDHIASMPKVQVVRSTIRHGLIRARIKAMKKATAPVVVFLDSHIECTKGWLEPLLDRISQNPTTVVSPVVDIINQKTFEYIPQELHDLRIGGFTWDLRFTWQTIPREVLKERKYLAAPIKTPTISGGLFAVDKTFFKKIGYFDDDLHYWGAENMELSFKTWMCGGSLEIIPCSRVGHVFRKKYPYSKRPISVRRNHIRVAKVWMDEYAKYVYERIGLKDNEEFGDITKNKLLRDKLKCKSFDWYLTEVYPQLEIPDKHAGLGKIYGLSGDVLCFDSGTTIEAFSENVKLETCHFMGGNQFWVYTKDGELKRDVLCLDDIGDNHTIAMNLCNGRKSQVWIYGEKKHQIINLNSKMCIGGRKTQNQKYWIIMTQTCDGNHRQTWAMDNYQYERLVPWLQKYTNKIESVIGFGKQL